MEKMNTFHCENDNEAIALVAFFNDCGYSTTRKGNDIKVKGDSTLLSYLYGKFVTIALI